MVEPSLTTRPVIDETLVRRVRAHLAQHNWLVLHVPQESMCYTIGLTQYGLPELVVLSQHDNQLSVQVDNWAARFVSGELQFGHVVTVQDLNLREHTFPTRPYDVTTRGGLLLAQSLFGQRVRARELAILGCRCLPCQAGLYSGDQES